MTKRERERVRRHAAVVAVAASSPAPDTQANQAEGLRRWRGDAAESSEALADIGRTCCPYLTLSVLSRISQCPNPND